MEIDSNTTDPSSYQTPDNTSPFPTHMSVSYYLYHAVDLQQKFIIHEVYPSTDSKKTYILCHQDQK